MSPDTRLKAVPEIPEILGELPLFKKVVHNLDSPIKDKKKPLYSSTSVPKKNIQDYIKKKNIASLIHKNNDLEHVIAPSSGKILTSFLTQT